MANKELSSRALRLREIYEESGNRSVSQFAREIGVKQSTIANFFSGLRDPSEQTLTKVLEVFPQYNRRWLLDGTGEKYNHDYVEVREDNDRNVEESRMAKKLAELYEKLVNYMERCSTLEEQLREANNMIAELKGKDICDGRLKQE